MKAGILVLAIAGVWLSSLTMIECANAMPAKVEACAVGSEMPCAKAVICSPDSDGLSLHDLVIRRAEDGSQHIDNCVHGSNGKKCKALFDGATADHCNVIVYAPRYEGEAQRINFDVRFQCSGTRQDTLGRKFSETFIMEPNHRVNASTNQSDFGQKLIYHETSSQFPNSYYDDIEFSSAYFCQYLN